MCMLDFILLYIIRYKGRSNNSHKIFTPEFLKIELFAINMVVWSPAWDSWDYNGGIPWAYLAVLNNVHLVR